MIPNEAVSSATPEVEPRTEEEPENSRWKSNDRIVLQELNVRRESAVALYRGEGNANVVLSVPSERKVIRFRKLSSTTKETVSSDNGRSRTTREIDFLKYVISGFLGDYIQPPEALRFTREEIMKINEAIRPLRPERRLAKEIVEEYATTFTDYTFLRKEVNEVLRSPDLRPTFCVEIKPKQGFRLRNDEQFKKCTYCLTQYHKLKVSAVSSRSRYCPFDLFSGSKERVRKSLRALLDSPQNNLKIFKNGVAVYDSSSPPGTAKTVLAEWFTSGETPKTKEQNFEAFSRLVSTALFREFSTDRGTSCETTEESNTLEELSSESFENRRRIDPDIVERAKRVLSLFEEQCEFVGDKIPGGSVLGQILGMQKLPYHSAETVYRIYSKHSGTLNDESFYSQMIEMCRGESKVSVKSKEKNDPDKNGNDNHNPTENGDRPMDLRNNNNRLRDKTNSIESGTGAIDNIEEFQALKNYLLSTTAKDCSVLMAFQEVDSTDVSKVPERFIVQSPDGIKFVVNVGVLDLDPKSVHCVEKHRLRDTNVLVSLADILEEKIHYHDSNLLS